MANYTIGRKRRGLTWSNNVIEGNGRLVFKGDFEFAMDRVIGGDPGDGEGRTFNVVEAF
jgi:hypothetical protein